MQTPEPSTPTRKDSLGCASSELYKDQEIDGAGIRFFRKLSRGAISQVETPATDRGWLVGVSLLGGHRREVLQGSQRCEQQFDRNDIYIRDFADSYRANLAGPFDFLLLELSQGALNGASDDGEASGVTALATVTGARDVVLASLVCALAPALDRPAEASRLFIDQMGLAISTHLVHRHGHSGGPVARRSLLSRTHEARAKELLRARIGGDVSIEEIASACKLSRSYFFRAFRETTGSTPHQWLTQQKLDQARHLLRETSLTLVEVAARCGFADQSHFTRVFTRAMKTSPGHWRRGQGSAQP